MDELYTMCKNYMYYNTNFFNFCKLIYHIKFKSKSYINNVIYLLTGT
jgi:hypothetical protein